LIFFKLLYPADLQSLKFSFQSFDFITDFFDFDLLLDSDSCLSQIFLILFSSLLFA